jgi:hypothetical protein
MKRDVRAAGTTTRDGEVIRMWPMFVYGLIVWAGGTLAARLAFDAVFAPGHPFALTLWFAATVVVAALVALPLYSRLGLSASQRRQAAIALALPGMVLDTLILGFSHHFVPGGRDAVVAAWTLWSYAALFLTAEIPTLINAWSSRATARRYAWPAPEDRRAA